MVRLLAAAFLVATLALSLELRFPKREPPSIPWGHDGFSYGWKQLEREQPDLQESWDGFAPEDQLRLLSEADRDGTNAYLDAVADHRAVLATCGPTIMPEFEPKPREPVCDLPGILAVPEATLSRIDYWLPHSHALYDRQLKLGAERLSLELERGELSKETLAWAKQVLSAQDYLKVQALADGTAGLDPRQGGPALGRELFRGPTSAATKGLLSADLGQLSAAKTFDGSAAWKKGGSAALAIPGDIRTRTWSRPMPPAAAGPPEPRLRTIWDAQRQLGKSPSEEQLEAEAFSRAWNQELRERMRKNPMGRRLDQALGAYPDVVIEPLDGPYGTYHAGGLIRLDSGYVADELAHYRALPPGTSRKDGKAMTALLNKDPELRAKILDGYEHIMVHELAHGAQDRAFLQTAAGGEARRNLKQHEKQAFVIQMHYAIEKSKLNPSPASPAGRFERQLVTSYLHDRERFFRDIAGTYADTPDLSEVKKEHAEKGTPLTELQAWSFRTKEPYFADFFEREKKEWAAMHKAEFDRYLGAMK